MLRAWSARSPVCALLRINCSVLMTLVLIVKPVENLRAEEIVLQNDSLLEGQDAAYMEGFEAHDIGAAVFELPEGVDAFRIDKVQILFLTSDEAAFETFVDIHLYAGVLPDPGAPVLTIPGAGLFPGMVNEALPSAVGENWLVYRTDGPFAVGVEYLFALAGAIDPTTGHLATDTNGCQSGKNMACDTATQTWFDPCSLVTPGNFVIRLVGEAFASMAPFGDWDDDGDVDQDDFSAWQQCYTGDFGEATPECGVAFDCDRNGRVDLTDLEQFEACASGPDVPADPECGPCLPTALLAKSPGRLPSESQRGPHPGLRSGALVSWLA